MRFAALRSAGDTLAMGARLAAEAASLALRPFEPRPAPPPLPARTRDGRWRQDVEYLARELPRLHANLFHSLPRGVFDALAAELVRDVPALADHEVRARLAALVAAAGDAHTAVEGWDRAPTTFPFAAYELSDGVFVTRAAPGWEHLLGCELLRIESRPIADVRLRAGTLIARENEQRLRLLAPRCYGNPDLLHALGIAPARGEARFELRNPAGQGMIVTLPAILASSAERETWPRAMPSLPLYRQRSDEPFWFAELEGGRVLYVKYSQCRHIRRFRRFARAVERRLDQGGIERVVIDFRGNGGGNSLQFEYLLLRGLSRRRELRGSGALHGLIDRATFSSAMLNAAQLRSHAGAILAGEPTGGKPNCHGEVRRMKLPNSGLTVTYSTRFVTSDPKLGDSPSLEPDLRIDAPASVWLAGRDPVLEAVVVAESSAG